MALALARLPSRLLVISSWSVDIIVLKQNLSPGDIKMRRAQRAVFVLLLFAAILLLRRRRRRRARACWVRPVFQERADHGEFKLFLQLRGDPDLFFKYTRMSVAGFDRLLALIKPYLPVKRSHRSSIRPQIGPMEQLAVTIRFLATGCSQTALSFSYRQGISTVHYCLVETCVAIWEALMPSYVRPPTTEEEWQSVSRQFERHWNFPNCVGAIDGKHVLIQAPAKAGSSFFNYKGSHSVVLLGVCDANYRFLVVDVGDAGRHSDGGVLSNSAFGQALEDEELHLPPPSCLPGFHEMPHVFVGDAAFPLRRNMMRPYPGKFQPDHQKIFNYRLSRARRTIENTFGILAARWRIFRQPINATPDNVVLFTKAAIALHNYLRVEESGVYCPPGFVDAEDGLGNVISGHWREHSCAGLRPIGRCGANMHGQAAKTIRAAFAAYFLSPRGEVSWQYNHVQGK